MHVSCIHNNYCETEHCSLIVQLLLKWVICGLLSGIIVAVAFIFRGCSHRAVIWPSADARVRFCSFTGWLKEDRVPRIHMMAEWSIVKLKRHLITTTVSLVCVRACPHGVCRWWFLLYPCCLWWWRQETWTHHAPHSGLSDCILFSWQFLVVYRQQLRLWSDSKEHLGGTLSHQSRCPVLSGLWCRGVPLHRQ